MSAAPQRLLVVADPRSPRWRCFRREPAAGLEVRLVDWRRVLEVGGRLDELAELDEPALLRIESPDKGEDVTRALLAAGAEAEPGRHDRAAASRAYAPGEMWPPAQLHAGLTATFEAMEASLAARPHVRTWLGPRAILTMFDKVATRRRLAEAGLPHPAGFEPTIGEDVMEMLRRGRFGRGYVKLRYGYAATGIVYFDVRRWQGISTVEIVDGSFRNSRRLRPRRLEDLVPILEHLVAEGATCEEAVPHAQIDGQAFDARLVVLEGRVAFRMFRKSRVPITNLHLVGMRADADRCIAWLGPRLYADACAAAGRACRALDARVAGVDVVFDRRRSRFALIELNAFGDFLPRASDEEGRTLHRLVLEATARWGASADQPSSRAAR